MLVTIFGATGMVGKQLVTHALAKGWQVRAFGRNVEGLIDKDLANENFSAIKGYVFDEGDILKAVKGADLVLSALGGGFDGTDRTRSVGMKNIVSQLQKAGVKRIVALGGLGVLPDENGHYLLEAEDYPQEYVPVGLEHKQAYEYLKDSSLDWTFVCSPNIIDTDANNHFTVKSEAPAGGNEISAGNLALFMVEEGERNEFVRQRVGISND